jgi:ligand-binding sensor domain-containing protein
MYLPPGAAVPTRMPFGLVGDKVGALFAAPGGVWVATERLSYAEPALTFVAADLSRFEVRRGSATFGLGYQQVRRIAALERDLWLATDQGVVRVEGGGSERVERVDVGRGLPDSRVYTVLARRGALFAGTARGAARINDSLRAVPVAPSFNGTVLSLEQTGDTLWLGTTEGLLLAPPDAIVAGRTPGLGQSAAFAMPIVALARLGDTLVALGRDRLLWREPRTDSWNLGQPLSAMLGPMVAFAPYRDGLWVAGERGVAFVTLESAPQRPLLAEEFPARIRDLASDGTWLWVATERGVVRWRIQALLP